MKSRSIIERIENVIGLLLIIGKRTHGDLALFNSRPESLLGLLQFRLTNTNNSIMNQTSCIRSCTVESDISILYSVVEKSCKGDAFEF